MKAEYIVCMLLAALFLALLAGFLWFISWLLDGDRVGKAADRIVARSADAAEKREEEYREVARREGNQEKIGLAAQYDRLILQSGIKKRLPFMNAGLYTAAMLVAGIAAAFFLYSLTNSPVVAGLAGAAAPLGMLVYLIVKVDARYKKVEEQLMPFVDLMGNFAILEDDLISILEDTIPYIQDPLQGVVSDCCTEAKTTGNVHAAIERLGDAAGHEQCRIILENVEICSRYSNDIALVIKDCRRSLAEYMAAKKARHSIVNSARAELLMIAGMGAFVVYMMKDLAEGVNLLTLLATTLPGQAILAFCLVVAFAAVAMLAATDKGRG